MAGSSNMNTMNVTAAPVFYGENYHIWSVKIKTYLRAYGLWDVVEGTAREPPQLPENPTMQQIKEHDLMVAKGFKALTCLHSAVTDVIFTRIMACETAKEAWDKLKEEFQGSDKTRRMQVITLRRDFEMLRMKDSESIKDYSDRVINIVNKIRLLGEELTDKRIVEKIVLTLPERFESKISSLEDSRDLSEISLPELINALQAQEQRRAIRHEELAEGAFMAKHSSNFSNSGKEIEVKNRKKYPPCVHCQRDTHLEKFCWFRPNVRCHECGQMGHIQKVCKNKQSVDGKQAQVVEGQANQEEELF